MSGAAMATRAPTILERPQGFAYAPGLLTTAEQECLVALLEALDYHEVKMRGQVARLDPGDEGAALLDHLPHPEASAGVKERAGVGRHALSGRCGHFSSQQREK
jgi:hypothetical protein